METHYSVLGCDNDSSFEVIKKQYQELALKYHPDKASADESEKFKDRFVLINKAWNVLKDRDSRTKYDAQLKHSVLVDNPLIYCTVEMTDLDYDDENSVYFYPCRCGEVYCVNKDEIISPEYIIGCVDCSFSLLIKS